VAKFSPGNEVFVQFRIILQHQHAKAVVFNSEILKRQTSIFYLKLLHSTGATSKESIANFNRESISSNTTPRQSLHLIQIKSCYSFYSILFILFKWNHSTSIWC